MLPEILAVAGLIAAAVALLRVAALNRRLTALSQSYWELRYDFGRLRARLAKVDGGASGPEPDAAADGKP